MKMIKSNFAFLLVLLVVACKEEKLKPITDGGGVPEVVKNIKVENLAGAVKISYDMPKGTSLLYVEAEVDMGNGRLATSTSSYYNNYLEIEGFGMSKEYEVTLYSVGRNLERSKPTVVNVTPLDPPIYKIFQSFDVREDFGGIAIKFENQEEAEVSVVVEREDNEGEWTMVKTFYTKQAEGQLAVRGLESELSLFRIYVNDRWGNQSNVLETELTPLFEKELDYTKFRSIDLLNDPKHYRGTAHPSSLWNNKLSGTSAQGGWYRTENGTPMPTQLTFDLGVDVKLSRFKFWQRGTINEHELLYASGSPRLMEIWGSNDPDPDGTYDSWTKLMEIEVVKPSGLPMNDISPEDLEVAQAGHEYIFPLETPTVRYLRIKVLRTFGVTEYFWMSEFDLFGTEQ